MDKPWFGFWRARDYKLRDFNWWEWTLVVLILAVAIDLLFMGETLRKYLQ